MTQNTKEMTEEFEAEFRKLISPKIQSVIFGKYKNKMDAVRAAVDLEKIMQNAIENQNKLQEETNERLRRLEEQNERWQEIYDELVKSLK